VRLRGAGARCAAAAWVPGAQRPLWRCARAQQLHAGPGLHRDRDRQPGQLMQCRCDALFPIAAGKGSSVQMNERTARSIPYTQFTTIIVRRGVHFNVKRLMFAFITSDSVQ
jgi:hypothetical protein